MSDIFAPIWPGIFELRQLCCGICVSSPVRNHETCINENIYCSWVLSGHASCVRLRRPARSRFGSSAKSPGCGTQEESGSEATLISRKTALARWARWPRPVRFLSGQLHTDSDADTHSYPNSDS